MRRWAWRVYLAVGLASLGPYKLLAPGLANDLVYVAIGVSGVAAIVVGIVVYRPQRRLPWQLMAVGQSLWVLGDAVDGWDQDVLHTTSYPSPADACYLAAYPVLAIGLLLLIRGRRPKRDTAGLLDSVTVTAGLGLLSWVLLARPTLNVSHYSFAATATGVAYPIADILLVGMLIRLVMTPGGRTPAFRLLLGAIALLIAGDTTSVALGLWTTADSDTFGVIWLASYVAWGTAALHPSMTRLSEPSVDGEARFTRSRLCALVAAALISPGVLAVQRVLGAPVDVWPVVAGSVIVFLLVVCRMNVAISQIVVANFDRDRLQDRLAHQAAHDSLTGLPNRTRALDAIGSAIDRVTQSGTSCAVLFVDLDGFKAVNDTYGHAAGDEVLRVCARRLRATVRDGDLVSRLGGDEFVILLEQFGAESIADIGHEIAGRAIDAIASPVLLGDGRYVQVGASVGVAVSRTRHHDAETLLHEADTAVYRAKTAGRGCVVIYDAALRRQVAEQQELEQALRYAIEHDELRVYYQPVVNLRTDEVDGYEALVRWQRPGHGLLMPDRFIETAEASALICDLDRWVLTHATRQMATWCREGRPANIAVNISRRHIALPRIVDDVVAALDDAALPAGRLILEITETVLDDEARVVTHCQQLRELGVLISIDDWGTGYNSLSRLRELPINVIKIDRSFLDPGHHYNHTLLQLMIQGAHAFGLPVVVEGVETPAQLGLLRSLGCELAQGYLFGGPLPAEQVDGRAAGLA